MSRADDEQIAMLYAEITATQHLLRVVLVQQAIMRDPENPMMLFDRLESMLVNTLVSLRAKQRGSINTLTIEMIEDSFDHQLIEAKDLLKAVMEQ